MHKKFQLTGYSDLNDCFIEAYFETDGSLQALKDAWKWAKSHYEPSTENLTLHFLKPMKFLDTSETEISPRWSLEHDISYKIASEDPEWSPYITERQIEIWWYDQNLKKKET